jgi:hypothetical protein
MLDMTYFALGFEWISAKISTALNDSRHSLSMALKIGTCYIPGAISWVVASISTTYWVAVLTRQIPGLKVGSLQLAGRMGVFHWTNRWNHLSKHRSITSESASLCVFSGLRGSVFPVSSSLAEGERSA